MLTISLPFLRGISLAKMNGTVYSAVHILLLFQLEAILIPGQQLP